MTIPGPISTPQQLMAVEPRKAQVCSKPATILLVEDDPGIRDFVQFALGASGYQVVVCATGEDALRKESEYAGFFDLVLTDLTMPGISGIDTASILVQRRPGVRVVLMSGYPSAENYLRSATIDAFIAKPFTSAILLSKVRAVLDRPDMPVPV